MAYTLYILPVAVISLGVFIVLPAPPLSQRLVDWKGKGSVFSWKNKNIFYIDAKGSGQNGDVICLHGFPTNSYDWIKILPDLQQEFRHIVMLDFLGYGFSDKPQKHTYTIGEQADIVTELIHHLRITKVHILSHDYGDTVALELVSRFNSGNLPFDVKSLAMMNGGIFPEVHHPRLVQKLLLLPVIGYIASHMFSYPLFCRSLSNVFGEAQPTSEDCEDFWAAVRYNDGDKATYQVINFLRERQAYKKKWVGALVSTKLKVLMIYGPADPVNPPEFEAHFKKTVPNHKIVTLDTAVGHYPQWEDPVSVSKAYKEFINDLHIQDS